MVRAHFFNRSILLTSNLTVRSMIKLFIPASVFIATVPLGKSLSAKFIHLLLGHCREKTYGKSAVINNGIL